jgi:aryl-alcohol dehydrogenase-like predicted oxidoreductase
MGARSDAQGRAARAVAVPRVETTRTIGGAPISAVVLGAMAPSGRLDRAERARTFHAAFDAGITAVDTAPLYELGGAEEVLGAVLKERSERIVVMSKVGLRWDGDHGDVLCEVMIDGARRVVRKDARPASIRKDVEEILRRLGREAIDVVHLHHPDRHTPLEESLGALEALEREGKVRAIGLSNHDLGALERAIAVSGRGGIASVQQDYSLLARWVEAEILPLCRREAVGFLAYSPLAQGLLAGRGTIESLAIDDPRRGDPRFHPKNLERARAAVLGALVDVARARGEELGTTALAWVLAQPGVTGVVVGARTPAQARRNALAMHRRLAPDEEAHLRAAFEAVRIDGSAGRGLGPRLRDLGERALRKVLRSVASGRARA